MYLCAASDSGRQWRTALFFNYIVNQSSNSASWSVKQLADWWWPVWEVQRRGWSLNVCVYAFLCVCVCDLSSTGSRINPHQSSNCSLSTHSHSRTQTVSAEGPLVWVSVRFPQWKITHDTGIQIHAVCRGLLPLDFCSPFERGAERLSVSPPSSDPPDFKTLSALVVNTHACTCPHTLYSTHLLWQAWRKKNRWEHNKNPIKRGMKRKLSRGWCGEANYHSDNISEFSAFRISLHVGIYTSVKLKGTF